MSGIKSLKTSNINTSELENDSETSSNTTVVDIYDVPSRHVKLKINLTIDSLDVNPLYKIKLNETIRLDYLDLLISSNLLKSSFNNKICIQYHENELKQLTSYRALFGKKDTCSIEYRPTKGMNFGRVYANCALGLSPIRREIRQTIARDFYVDIDVVNAHPVMLFQICKDNGIVCKYLKKYVMKRDEFLKAVMDEYNVNRDSAKQLFIKLLYFGGFRSWAIDNQLTNPEELSFIKKFRKEFKQIGYAIVANNPKLTKIVERSKEDKQCLDYNLNGSVVSTFLQEYENRILTVIFKYCVDNGYIRKNNCVLCFDGLMIEKKYYKPELLDELHKLVLDKFGFDLTFLNKPMTEGYTFEQLQEAQIPIEMTPFGIAQNEFEKTHFKITEPLSYATVKDDGSLVLRNKKDFMDVYENYCPAGVDFDFVPHWFKTPSMRTFERIDFLPRQQAPPNIYNTFTGYKAESLELNEIDINSSCIMKHIKHVICNDSEEVFTYFISFLANLIKQPYKIANTALVIKSLQGAGKDTIFEWFGKHILGDKYYINTDKPELLFGRFNSCIENKILVVMNEVSGKDSFQINENIKCAITAKENVIEHKGRTPYKNTNHVAYVFLTNNDNPIKIPHDDRRFTGFECNNELVNNKDYFNALYEEINSCKYDRAFYDYFMNIDVETFDFIKNRPITNFYNNMREMNIPIMAKFFESIVDSHHSRKSVDFQSSVLFNMFTTFIKDNNSKVDYTQTKFGIDIKAYDGITKEKKYVITISIDIPKLRIFLAKKYNIEFYDKANDFLDGPVAKQMTEQKPTLDNIPIIKQHKEIEEFKLQNIGTKHETVEVEETSGFRSFEDKYGDLMFNNHTELD